MVGAEKEFQEALASIRHYSNLRFLILPIFVFLNGGLVGVVEKEVVCEHEKTFFWIGVGTSIVFIFIETILDGYIRAFSGFVRENFPGSHLDRLDWRRHLVIVLIWCVYGLFGVIWFGLAMNWFMPSAQ